MLETAPQQCQQQSISFLSHKANLPKSNATYEMQCNFFYNVTAGCHVGAVSHCRFKLLLCVTLCVCVSLQLCTYYIFTGLVVVQCQGLLKNSKKLKKHMFNVLRYYKKRSLEYLLIYSEFLQFLL